jgi:hypothetical protein
MSKRKYLFIPVIITFLYFIATNVFLIQNLNTSLFHVSSSQSKSTSSKVILNHIQKGDNDSLCTSKNQIKTQVKFYKLSTNNSYHYEYQYELNKQKASSNESRLVLLFTGINRKCIDWWDFSVGEDILSKMRLSGFSILAICTPRKSYDITVPIQKNLDVYWIYITLQMWIHDVYYKYFQHYPRLYLFGISRGSQMCSLLCRVLPVQAQILYIYPGNRPSLLIHSDHDREMQNRLIIDPTFANWFYFVYCSKSNSTANNQCPFRHLDKNYFNPVPPTYFIHVKNDHIIRLSSYTKIISEMKNDAFHLGGTLLTHHNAVKLYVVHPLEITPDYMKDNFDKWSCKPWSSKFFYEHFINSTYNARFKRLRTCWCTKTNFLYFSHHSNITKKWSKTKQEQYHDYVRDIQTFNIDLCEHVCGNLMATHAMLSQHIETTLSWLNDMDQLRSLYRNEDLSRRPLRLWMYNKSELVHDIKYLSYQTPMKTSCGRHYHANQMYSPEYFLQDYFQRLNELYPLSRHNLIWANDPLLADYYIIPHDYSCISTDKYRPTLTNLEYRLFHTRINREYFSPLLTNVRTLFPYWNMTSGSNHIIAFTVGKNMGVIEDRYILKNVIQLSFTGLRQDLLPLNSPRIYPHRNVTPVYRHNYDILVPPFNRLQWIHSKSPIVNSDLRMWYKAKKRLLFFAGTINNSVSLGSVRRRLLLLLREDIGKEKRYEEILTIDGNQFNTMTFIDGHLSPADYVESVRSSIFNLCLEGFSPWSPRLYESICLGAIPLILAQSIVLPFERFIDRRSFSMKVNVDNVRNIVDLIQEIDQLEDYVINKLKNAAMYFHAFRWPYSPVDGNHDRHVFLPEEDMKESVKNVFHYLSLELRCRRLEQFYGLTSDSLSITSISAKRQVCRNYSKICPCYEEQQSLALEEYI